MIRSQFLFIVLFLLGATSHAGEKPVTSIKEHETAKTVAQRDLLIGTWHGEAPTKEGGKRLWDVIRYEDGTYQVNFTITEKDGSTSSQSEIGIWGTSAEIYFTAARGFVEAGAIEPADTTDPALYDVYKILDLTGEIFEYENLSTGNRFLVKRIKASPSAP